MRRRVRLVAGLLLGGGGLLFYLWYAGFGDIATQLRAVGPVILAVVAGLVILEGVVDGLGVWASVRPLGDGLTSLESVQFALAGDFFDIVSPAGPASSEPIMAQFIRTTTETNYSEALGVRSVAKYVKSAAQVLLSTVLAVLLLQGNTAVAPILRPLAIAAVAIVGIGVLVAVGGPALSQLLVTVVTVVVRVIRGLVPWFDADDAVVENAVGRFRRRIGEFRTAPLLVGLIAVGGILEQTVVATALWLLLSELGVATAFVPILMIVPLPQVGTVVPIPASLGSYDVLLGGALVLTTGVSGPVAASAVLVFRGLTLLFGLAAGGFCAAQLRGWDIRP
jgi:uncharacterized membrane protein YbhN (UPF0104 family)